MTLVQQITSLTQAIGAKIKDLYGRAIPAGGTNGQVLTKNGSTDYATAWTTPSATGATIDDSAPSASKVYSSTKTESFVNAKVTALVNGSPAVLDTLKELADALNDDPNFAATTATALGNRVRVDAPQSLTTAQQTQARANVASYGLPEIGDPTTDYVATFNAALV